MLALLDYEAQQCTGCGGYLPDTTDPDSEWQAGPPIRCYRCTAAMKQQRRPEYSDPDRVKGGPIEALVGWPVKRVR